MAASAGARTRGRARPPSVGRYGHGDVASSLVLIFPLLLAYEVGVLFGGHVNGADIVTRSLFSVAGGRGAYLLVHVVIALAFLVWIRRERRWATLSFDVAAPVILEAAIYALTLGALGTLVVENLLGLGSIGGSIVSALGAGVHEELVFRLGLLAALVALFRHVVGSRLGLAVALLGSSLVFAGAHHLGAHGETFTAHAFAFRTVAGCVFGAVFWFRSLAHAVYAHVFYDVLVTAL
jgi:hypothetical protein